MRACLVLFVLFVCFCFNTPLSLAGNSGHLIYVLRAALPIPISVCSTFVYPNDGMAASIWDFYRAHRC